MIDPELLLERPAEVAAALATKGTDQATVDGAVEALQERRRVRSDLDALRAVMNSQSSKMRDLLRADPEAAQTLRAELVDLKSRISVLEQKTRELDATARDAILLLPNIPDHLAPVGDSEDDNAVVRYEGEALRRPDNPTHWDIADELGWWEPQRAARMSGSGFAILRGDGAKLLRALVSFGLDLNRGRYEEFIVPHLVRGETMVGTGHLPKFSDDAYSTADDMWAIPTGEVPLTGLHRGEILDADQLPYRYMTYTTCFRREAGSAGKDTRGLQRLHEFHKVELMVYCRPDQTPGVYAELMADAEKTLQVLKLPYRVLDLCTGDLTFSSARIFDLEVYSPGVDRWLEVSSVGNFTDFQARRSGIRMRTARGTVPVNTLNASAMATPRVWAALLEHGVQNDGTVLVPQALERYLGTDRLVGNPRKT